MDASHIVEDVSLEGHNALSGIKTLVSCREINELNTGYQTDTL